jgi:hypothetical protein
LLFSWEDFKIVIIAVALSNIVGIIKMPFTVMAKIWLINNFSDESFVIAKCVVLRIWHGISNPSCPTDRFILLCSLLQKTRKITTPKERERWLLDLYIVNIHVASYTLAEHALTCIYRMNFVCMYVYVNFIYPR